MSDRNVITVSIPVPNLGGRVRGLRASLYLALAGLSIAFIVVASIPDYNSEDMYRYGVALGVMTLLVTFYNGYFARFVRPDATVASIRTELFLLAFLFVQWMTVAIIATVTHDVGVGYGAIIWIGWLFLLSLFVLVLAAASAAHWGGRTEVWNTSMAEFAWGERHIQLPSSPVARAATLGEEEEGQREVAVGAEGIKVKN